MPVFEEVLFAWVHVSDIHMGHGSPEWRDNQETVLRLIVEDVRDARAKWPELPQKFNAIMVTGDCAFSGASRSADEYDLAAKWLDELCEAADVSRADILLVPGNHDVQRETERDFVVHARQQPDQVRQILERTADGRKLRARFENFQKFAKSFAPESGDVVTWHKSVELPHDIKLAIIGVNSALLAHDDADAGKLVVLESNLRGLLRKDRKLVKVLLSHHPLHGGWWYQEQKFAGLISQHATVHLCGHTHEPESVAVTRGGGRQHVKVVAAASHGEPGPDGGAERLSHGYNMAALICDSTGRLKLRVWPRRWFPQWQEFRVDAHQVRDRELWTDHPLETEAPRVGGPLTLDTSGFIGVAQWDQIQWDNLLRGARKFDAIGITLYDLLNGPGTTAVREFLARGGKLRMVLADPRDPRDPQEPKTMAVYDSLFDKPPGDRERKVRESLNTAVTLQGVEVRVTKVLFRYSAYRIDDDVIFVPYRMEPGKAPGVIPVLAMRHLPSGGPTSKAEITKTFVTRDMDWLMENSELVTAEGLKTW